MTPFLSIKEETSLLLRRLRRKDESDDALIKRILEYAKGYMIAYGMLDEKVNP